MVNLQGQKAEVKEEEEASRQIDPEEGEEGNQDTGHCPRLASS